MRLGRRSQKPSSTNLSLRTSSTADESAVDRISSSCNCALLADCQRETKPRILARSVMRKLRPGTREARSALGGDLLRHAPAHKIDQVDRRILDVVQRQVKTLLA